MALFIYKHYRFNCILAVVFSTALTNCSSSPVVPNNHQIRDSFKTSIKANELKLFTYRAWLINSINSPSRPPSSKAFIKKLEWGLKQTIKNTGYCRSGYIEITRSINDYQAKIRGECKDSATDEDFRRFSK